MNGRRFRVSCAGMWPPAIGLTSLLVGWRLLVAGLVALALPSLAMSAPPHAMGLAVGQRMRIRQSGIPNWPVPTSRLAFDTFQRGVRESDEDAINEAFEASEWVAVNHGDPVQVVAVDGEVAAIELLDGSYAGRRV